HLPAAFDELDRFTRIDTSLLRLKARVDLDVEARVPALLADFRSQGSGDFLAVDSLDDIKQSDRVFRLVGLQRANQMQHDVAELFAQFRPLCLGFLNAVFAEGTLTGSKNRADLCCIEGLGNRYKCNVLG